jgi:D-glycero-alpha-D-manno-heptose 1-phosphate guanylyltransferase
MEAIILAGGFGTRLRSVVSDVPKPMAPVGGRPFLELLLTSLKAKGLTRAILSVGYKSEIIMSYFDRNPAGVDVTYEVERSPLGTGGAIAAALRRAHDDHVFVFNGDTFLNFNLSALEATWPGDRTPIVVARSVPDTARYGKLECTGGRISRFLGAGHDGPGVINAGCYLIPKDIFASVNLPAAFSFEEDFLACRPSMSLRMFLTSGEFLDIGLPADYLRAESLLGLQQL